MRESIPDYSPYAAEYAQSRPRYPADLFSYLASLVDRHKLAWDCATGNGQAALGLAKYFGAVVATDISAEQINHATRQPQIEYRVAASDRSGLGDQSADLVTVASALHWFDIDAFCAEVIRVMRPSGVLAAWTYHVGHVEPPFREIFRDFYENVLSPYFAPRARLVDDKYRNITLPGKTINAADFFVSAVWNLDQVLQFIRSWSGTQRYMRELGEDPIALIREQLERVWGNPGRTRVLQWPLYIRISKL